MNNREREFLEIDSVHIYIAIRRKKENDRELQELCFREIAKKDDEVAIDVLKAKIKEHKGIWRIYKTVNKRKVEPAMKLMMKHLIDEPEKFMWRIDSLWKNCLLQKECKAERNFLIDVDANWNEDELANFFFETKIEPYNVIKTPNGWHILAKNVDTRRLQGYEEVEVKRDDIYFMERFEVK